MILIARAALFAAVCLALGACASGKQIVTGTEREPTSPEQIALYAVLPADAEIIAVMSASCAWGFTGQQNVRRAEAKLRAQAAAIGANGLLIEHITEERVAFFSLPFLFNSLQKINAKALYVPPVQE